EGGGALEAASGESENQASEEEAHAGFEEFHAELTAADGRPASGADSHPYEYVTSFAVNVSPPEPGSAVDLVPSEGDLKEVEVTLPPGLAGNPTAIQRCAPQQFTTLESFENSQINQCPVGSAVGLAIVEQVDGGPLNSVVPIYNLVPPKGMPARFGF